MNRSNLVTTRTGLTIGSAYIPPAPPPSRDAEAIQSALLGEEASRWERALDLFNRYTPHVFVAVFVVGLVLAATRKLWA